MKKKTAHHHTPSSDYENVISLLNIYLTEWIHRDQILWAQVFKLFYAILIVILLPNVASYLNITLPAIPAIFFRVFGLISSIIFFYISVGYLKRLEAIGNTYQKLINKLPEEYQRQRIYELRLGWLFIPRTSYLVCGLLFLSLFFLSIILMLVR